MVALATGLRRLPSLRSLSVEACGLEGDDIVAVCEAVRVSDKLLDLLYKVVSGIINPQSLVSKAGRTSVGKPNLALGFLDRACCLLTVTDCLH